MSLKNVVDNFNAIVAANPDGYLKGATCNRCGAALRGQGSGNPAESYLGTFNGFCGDCTALPPYIVRFFADGAFEWSWPPSEPSHRRDRPRFIAYEDCESCKGEGGKIYYAHYGRNYGSCIECVKRFENHPLRKHFRERTSTRFRWLQKRQEHADRQMKRTRGEFDYDGFKKQCFLRLEIHESRLSEWKNAFRKRHEEIVDGMAWGVA